MKATDIMHPEDAKAIQMIKSVPGYEKLVRLFMKLGYEMQYRGENLANMIRVTPHCYPQIYGLFKEVVNKTGIKEPELYIYNDPEMNAYTYGETRTFVALSSSIVEKLTPEEKALWHTNAVISCASMLYIKPCSEHYGIWVLSWD